MDPTLIDQKMTQLREELQKAEDELARVRGRVQYLEAMAQRIDGALTVLQGLKDDMARTVVPASVNTCPIGQGA